MLPPYYDGMFLPAGDHPATWEDIEERFCWNQKRQAFCARLRAFLDMAKRCGFVKVYLFGSFISANSDPGDVDLLWVYEQNDLDRLSKACRDLIDYNLNKAREQWDMWCCSNDQFIIDYLMEGWRKDKTAQQTRRGVIIMKLVDYEPR